MPTHEEQGQVAESGLLRAIRAEARIAERTRIRDMLSTDALSADERAAQQHPSGRGRWATPAARTAAGLREALAVFDRRFGLIDLTAGEAYVSLSGPVDSVELFQFDEPDEQGEDEPMPVRIAVHDGAEDSTACAYLTLDEAEEVFREGLALVELIRRRRETADDEGSWPEPAHPRKGTDDSV
jgi:hypothetical protein